MKKKPEDDIIVPPTPEISRSVGKDERARVPRSKLADFDPSARKQTALNTLRAQEADRVQQLLPLRYGRMATSPWAYLRGAVAVMAADLGPAVRTNLNVQLCGDAHLLNFGFWASPERLLLFDLNDFDETLTGPFEWDLKRLATSVLVLAAENKVTGKPAVEATLKAIRTYQDCMRSYADEGELDIWYDKITSDAALEQLKRSQAKKMSAKLASAQSERSGPAAVEKFTEVVNGQRRIIANPPKRVRLSAQTAVGDQLPQEVITSYVATQPTYRHRLLKRFKVVDSVQQVVGVGSVGMRVILVLAEGQSGRQPLLLQIKEAVSSVYEPYLEPSPFNNHAQRVVNGQRLMQSASDIFLGWVTIDGRDYYVRQFRDMKIAPDASKMSRDFAQFAVTCARTLAKAHARSGNPNALNEYMGTGKVFSESILTYAQAYAKQTETDHAELVDAVRAGEVIAMSNAW